MRGVRRYTKKEKVKRASKLFFAAITGFPILVFIFFLVSILRRTPYLSPIPTAGFKIPVISDLMDPTRDLSERLSKAHVTFSSVVQKDNSYNVTLSQGEEIIFSKDKSLDSQISSLQLILRSLTIEGKRVARLDFRFDNPVIVFK
jgi:hypothetical protein